MLQRVKELFFVRNPADLARRASYNPCFPRSPFLSQAPWQLRKKDSFTQSVTGATAPHLALGPRLRPRPRPLLRLKSTPREHLGPAPAYPGAGHVYRLRTVVRKGSGLPRAQPQSRPAPLIRCRRRHRRWARRAAGIALRLPPWPPPPPPPASDKDPALSAAAVSAATAAAATGSPGRLRASRPARPATSGPPRPIPSRKHVIGYPRPGRAVIRGHKSILGPAKAALFSHWGAPRQRQLSHDLPEAAGPAKTARDERFCEPLEAWPSRYLQTRRWG